MSCFPENGAKIVIGRNAPHKTVANEKTAFLPHFPEAAGGKIVQVVGIVETAPPFSHHHPVKGAEVRDPDERDTTGTKNPVDLPEYFKRAYLMF
tara:strand:+ start:244 stop:525 length:282 start_codon:yes stop_codon:yes gene_type:complete